MVFVLLFFVYDLLRACVYQRRKPDLKKLSIPRYKVTVCNLHLEFWIAAWFLRKMREGYFCVCFLDSVYRFEFSKMQNHFRVGKSVKLLHFLFCDLS